MSRFAITLAFCNCYLILQQIFSVTPVVQYNNITLQYYIAIVRLASVLRMNWPVS